MNPATAETFKSLAHRRIARVDVIGDVVELAVPESEGWRLVISAALDERAQPTLAAHWEPGLRRPRRRTLRRLIPHRRHHYRRPQMTGQGRH